MTLSAGLSAWSASQRRHRCPLYVHTSPDHPNGPITRFLHPADQCYKPNSLGQGRASEYNVVSRHFV